ncbi:2-oxoglutarate (2OG) and Fe(II)-dependent oxygenase superfamily protein [Trifolium repens]|nr:2-oxoglutarate (2OG) and Fe(II)-dependent oxygenase superfamily protein [Trifolium repens]
MANNVLVSELSKSILEMSMNGDEPPSEYLIKGNSFGSKEDSSTLIPIPIIDVSLLSSQGELEKLKSALSSVGCFQAIGHGMLTTYLDKIRQVAKLFFALPVEEKQNYAMPEM